MNVIPRPEHAFPSATPVLESRGRLVAHWHLSLRYLLPSSRWIGLQVNDQATNTNPESSQWIFQRYKRSHPEKA